MLGLKRTELVPYHFPIYQGAVSNRADTIDEAGKILVWQLPCNLRHDVDAQVASSTSAVGARRRIEQFRRSRARVSYIFSLLTLRAQYERLISLLKVPPAPLSASC